MSKKHPLSPSPAYCRTLLDTQSLPDPKRDSLAGHKPAGRAEPLKPVVGAAAEIGITICNKTAVRWCLHGRRGRRLPSLKVSGRRMTLVSVLRRWLVETEDGKGCPLDFEPPIDSDAILAAYRLGRNAE